MNIHEYQAKEILSEFGVNIPRGGLAYSPAQAVFRANEIGAKHGLGKAQIHSGARSSVGGIKRCSSDEEIRQAADELGVLPALLVPQTTQHGVHEPGA